MNKIFCFNNGGNPGCMLGMAISEDGYCIAQHVSTHEGFMKHDLGMTSDWKHENYNEHYGKGNWELEWVKTEEVNNHEGLQKAIKLNIELAEAEDKQKAEEKETS